MGEIGCYVLDLYCDVPEPTCPEVGRAQFTGSNLDVARAEAMKAGWKMQYGIPTTEGSGHPPWACPSCAEPPVERPKTLTGKLHK